MLFQGVAEPHSMSADDAGSLKGKIRQIKRTLGELGSQSVPRTF